MPRASYGERHTVSVMQGVNQVVFDVTSKIVDFITIDEQGADGERPGKGQNYLKCKNTAAKCRLNFLCLMETPDG
jgi:hypothetical protein